MTWKCGPEDDAGPARPTDGHHERQRVRRSHADFVSVRNHGPSRQSTNQQPSMVMLADRTLAAAWTLASVEAAKGESVVFSTSPDGGMTWSWLSFVERAEEDRTASWGGASRRAAQQPHLCVLLVEQERQPAARRGKAVLEVHGRPPALLE